MTQDACPDFQTLQRFLSGAVAESQTGRLESHVSGCERCAATLAKLSGDDSILLVMQGISTSPKTENHRLASLVQRVLATRAESVGADEESSSMPPTVSLEIAAETESRTGAAAAGNSTGVSGKRLDIVMPEQFGRYKIVKKLGSGGMGTVYLAEDTKLKRPVALKVPRFDVDAPTLIERFYREAQAMAALHHPNICPVYDVDEIENIHYLTMAVIEGRTLTSLIKSKSEIPVDQAVAIVIRVAMALDEAHSAGIVHRDLKPDNIMLNTRDQPVIMDFGLARQERTEQATLTRYGEIMGTPAYMSPEQVDGQSGNIGPATDIYSLGIILFEMMAGKRPFSGSVAAVMGKIMLQEPPAPSSFGKKVDPELEQICLRAIAKDITVRFPSAGEFATALINWTEKRKVEEDSALKKQPRKLGFELLHTLENHSGPVRAVAISRDGKFAVSCGADSTVRQWLLDSGTQRLRLNGHEAEVRDVTLSKNGRYAVSGGSDRKLLLWDLKTGEQLANFSGHAAGICSVALSSDTMTTLTLASGDEEGTVILWETRHQRILKRLTGHRNAVRSVCFSPDGKLLASSDDDGFLRIWNVQSGDERPIQMGHGRAIADACFSPDGRSIVSAGNDATIRLWDAQTGSETRRFRDVFRSIETVCFLDQGKLAVSGGWDNIVRLWDVATGTELYRAELHSNWITRVASASDDDKIVVASSLDSNISVWRLNLTQ